MWYSIALGLHVTVALLLISLVLLQRGKGAEAGTGFGAGASGTVFGARGSANFLSRSTAVLATLFFVTCLSLVYLSTQAPRDDSVLTRANAASPPAAIGVPGTDDDLGPPLDASAPPNVPEDNLPNVPDPDAGLPGASGDGAGGAGEGDSGR
jgi:preprotein translocase subunit SecG